MKHLYEVMITYGILVVVAESIDEVLSIVKASKWYKNFHGLMPPASIENQIDEIVLKFTTEIVGYEVNGESKIIAHYQE